MCVMSMRQANTQFSVISEMFVCRMELFMHEVDENIALFVKV